MLTQPFSGNPCVAAISAMGHRLRAAMSSMLDDAALVMGFGPFAQLEDNKLSDHHWAVESALLRAVRLGHADMVAELTQRVCDMEREMRRRDLL